MHSDSDIGKRRIYRNGGLDLHIGRIAQGWQSGIIQILKEHTSAVWKQQKNFVRTVLHIYQSLPPDYVVVRCMRVWSLTRDVVVISWKKCKA